MNKTKNSSETLVQNKKKMRPGVIVSIVIMSILSLAIILPLLYVVSVSFTSDKDIVQYGYRLIPHRICLDAYKHIFNTAHVILRAYGVTILVTILGTFCSLSLTTVIAYVAARRDFPYRKLYSIFLLIPLLFNGGMVATYIVNSQVLHLTDTIFALFLPYSINVWYTFMMRSFMNNLPFELVESAQIDGAGEFRTFFQIVLPLCKASLATIGLFYAFAYWNDWWLAMMYVSNPRLKPLQQLLQKIMANAEFYASMAPASMAQNQAIPKESLRMALAVVAIGPMLAVFPFFQKYFVKGVTVGSVKG